MALSATVGRLCAMISLFIPAYLIVVMAGWRRALEVAPAIIACGVSFAGMQFTVSNFVGPELTDIASSLTCIAVMVLVMKVWKPRNIMRFEGDPPVEVTGFTPPSGVRVERGAAVAVATRRHTAVEIFSAWLPYLLLVAFVLVWGEVDVKAALNRFTNGLLPAGIPRSPTLLNGLLVPGLHNMIQRVPPVVAQPTAYGAVFELNWLSASGTSCFLATIAAALVLGVRPARFGRLYVATFKQLALAMLTLAGMLGLAYLMNYSGMTSTLGLALAGTGSAFPFFSAVLGWLGVFLTGSDTSANALFGNLQVVTANALQLNPVLMASVNSAAGVMGKMISILSIAVAVAATGMTTADEGRLFRFTIKHSVLLMALMGIISMLFAYVFSAYVPTV
jgi:lactate permease